jgi:hypothetical protein
MIKYSINLREECIVILYYCVCLVSWSNRFILMYIEQYRNSMYNYLILIIMCILGNMTSEVIVNGSFLILYASTINCNQIRSLAINDLNWISNVKKRITRITSIVLLMNGTKNYLNSFRFFF